MMTRRAVGLLWLFPALSLAIPALRATGADPAQPPTPRSWHVANQGPKAWRLLTRLPTPVEYSEVRQHAGDDPGWALPDFDDGSWKVIARGRPPWVGGPPGIQWLRMRVRWNSPEGRLPAGVNILFLYASYEIYWDGRLVGQNGIPAERREDEVEGLTECRVALTPDQTGAGEHLLAVRLSTWHLRSPDGITAMLALVTTPEALEAGFRKDNILPVMAAGALFTIMIAALVMWFVAARRRIFLLFGGLCLFAAVMQSVSWYSMGYVYPISWHFSLECIVAAAGFGVSLCLAAIICEEWNVPRRRAWLAAVFVVDVIVLWREYPFLVYMAPHTIAVAITFALGCCGWAAWRRRRSVVVIALAMGTTAFLLWQDMTHFVGLEFFQRFLPAILGLIVAIALRLRDERRQVQEMKLTAARLEIELLKKNLQPHFLMNTLTALAQTVEEAPGNAVKLIDDLAAEFRTLARMAGEKTVTLEQELQLCRAHLRVMQARTDLPWSLDADGIDGTVVVPPALFLTLIENGFSHQRPRKGDNVFTLRASTTGRTSQFTFRSPGEVTGETNRSAGGTGLRYIKARLEESFPGGWKLTQGEVDGAWQTVIEIAAAQAVGVPA